MSSPPRVQQPIQPSRQPSREAPSSGGGVTLVCSCERTMPLDVERLETALGGAVIAGHQLCGLELDRARAAIAGAIQGGVAPTIACTRQAALFTEAFEELAGERAAAAPVFVDVRESAGWSSEGAQAGPKIAALIAAAAQPMPALNLVTLESRGVALIYGRDERAIEAGAALADRLDVTVMLTRPRDVAPPRAFDFPVVQGTVRAARGHLGAFELSVDEFALPAPSSRASLRFNAARDGATSHCDIVLDLSGGTPLFPAADLRPGYVRADAGDRAAIERAIAQAGALVGTFDKPRYVDFRAELCAHARSGVVGCTRCLDLCPTGAITPAGEHVAIDAAVCAGCGSCAAACPTGAASYGLPPADALLRKLRTLLTTYAQAGGRQGVVLFHDGDHGAPLIDALARFGDGLPAHVLPLRVNEITQLGPEFFAGLFAWGGAGALVLARAKPRHDIAGASAVIETANAIASALGFGDDLVALLETDDPDALAQALARAPRGRVAAQPAPYTPRGAKRAVLEDLMRELHRVAPTPTARVALAKGAPFGAVTLDVAGCTLCHACVAACPTGALGDNADKPMLLFTESACVQCGLCQGVCPEKVIRIAPGLDFEAWSAGARVLKEEEPYPCISCGKPFGSRASIERVLAKLQDRHWMFTGANARRLDVVRMCEDCRVAAVVNEGFDPHDAPPRPPVMTTEDYLRAREQAQRNGAKAGDDDAV